jgi:hypothetical protein
LKNRKEPNMNEIERAIELISAGEIDYSGVFDPAINKDVETIILEALREKAERSRAKSFNVQSDMFGEYCLVPTGYSKEKHVYKIVTHFQSNSYCDVPLMHDSKPVLHDSVIDVLNVIHCGIDETKVKRVALRDVELCGKRLEVEHDG